VATKTIELDPSVAATVYCGPAIVREIGPVSVTLQLPDREARAELALAYPYRPQLNDMVLALGTADGDLYIVGVLRGKGTTRLCVDGDLEIETTGQLNLRGGAGVGIAGELVSVTADRYEVSARSVVERLGDVYRWTKGVIMTCAGRTRTVVETSATLAAARIVEKAKEDVVIDGEQIRLG
jgi:hypothetical protein